MSRRTSRRASQHAEPDSPIQPYEDERSLPSELRGQPFPPLLHVTRRPSQEVFESGLDDDLDVPNEESPTFEEIIDDVEQWYHGFRHQVDHLRSFTIAHDTAGNEQDENFRLRERNIPLLFRSHPGTHGEQAGRNQRRATKSDVEGALESLILSRNEEHISPARVRLEVRQMYKYLDSCSHVVTRVMGGLSSRSNVVLSYQRYPYRQLPEFIMQFFTDLAYWNNPEIPIAECDDNWMARYFLEREWNYFASDMRRRFPRPRGHHRYPTSNNPLGPPEVREDQQQEDPGQNENQSPSSDDIDPVEELDQVYNQMQQEEEQRRLEQEPENVAPQRRRRYSEAFEEEEPVQLRRSTRRRNSTH